MNVYYYLKIFEYVEIVTKILTKLKKLTILKNL